MDLFACAKKEMVRTEMKVKKGGNKTCFYHKNRKCGSNSEACFLPT